MQNSDHFNSLPKQHHSISEETNDRKSPVIAVNDDGTTCSGTTVMEVASDDVVMISSSESNTNECNTDSGNTLSSLYVTFFWNHS